jgi:hypothetical protein
MDSSAPLVPDRNHYLANSPALERISIPRLHGIEIAFCQETKK